MKGGKTCLSKKNFIFADYLSINYGDVTKTNIYK